MNKIILIFIIYLIITQINLLSLINCSYEIKSDIPDYDQPQLFVSTHDYEHIDLFVLINEFIKYGVKVTIIAANEIWNHILYYYLLFIGVFHIDFIFVTENTVQKMIDVLKNDEHVLIYLYRNNTSTGIYHTVKENNVPITLCQIKSEHKPTNYDEGESVYTIFTENIGKEYTLSYENYNYSTNQRPDNFIQDIKNNLYTI